MTEEPTFATIPPTPIIDCPKPPRPVLVTISAVFLFIFAAVEAVQVVIRAFTFSLMNRILSNITSPPTGFSPPGAIPDQITFALFRWIPRIEALLAIVHIAFTVFFILYGIGLLRMKSGIRERIFTGLITRFFVINSALFTSQWIWWRITHSTTDFWMPATLTALNFLFYTFVISLLMRPAVRDALTKESISADLHNPRREL